MLCLKLDESAFRELGTSDAHRIALIEPQRLHHPVGEVNDAFIGDELKDTGVSRCSRVLRVPKLEHPWGFKIKRSEVSESRWG
jgi:hypothetical protein